LEIDMMIGSECLVTFPVRSGILGVDRLAKRLKALAATDPIGDWHIGHWVDWRHTAIRIRFGTVADAGRAKLTCFDAGNPPDLQP
jgi:hypothetical protein